MTRTLTGMAWASARVVHAWAACAACALCVACTTGQPSRQASGGRIEPVYSKDGGELTLLRYDADHDGRVETFSYMAGTRVVRIEIDADGDSLIDRWEHYAADGSLDRVGTSRAHDGREDSWSYADAAGHLARIEIASRGDGRVDRTEHYRNNALISAEEDSDHDGTVDRWEWYEAGRLARLSFDTSHAGAPTSTLLYHADGSVEVH